MTHFLLNHIMALSSGEAQCGPKEACATGLPVVSANSGNLHNLLQIVFAVAAALAAMMIVLAGLRFITGQGNPQEMSKARSTIVYAVAGLLVALAAEAIVSLVLNKL